jgi:hypothetical protein
MQLTAWLLVEVALLLIGLIKISFFQKLVLTVREYEINCLLDYQLSNGVINGYPYSV